jgi:6-phosphofructokinase 1
VESPLAPVLPADPEPTSFGHIHEDDRVLLVDTVDLLNEQHLAPRQLPSFEPCHPRRRLFFDPSQTTVAIVTCGGLCPGLNDVVRALVGELRRQYGVKRVLGIRHGYLGLTRERRDDVIELSARVVRDIHQAGGTFLGSSRGQRDPQEMVDTLLELGVDVLLVVGGDGTMRGAQEIVALAERRAPVSVIGIPKTIDNDLPFIDYSFGFQTAVAEAAQAVRCAQAEAHSVRHGVSVVKLMGRHGGFIACHAAIALNDVDFVLVPEVSFAFDGEHGLLAQVRERVHRRGHVVCAT